jgi:hypothetical protein
VLIEQGHVTEEQIEQALALQSVAADPERIGEVLVDVGHISESAISEAISQQIQSALVSVLRDRDGTFEFSPADSASDDTSQHSSRISFEPLVLNATYLADRWLAEQVPEQVDLLPDRPQSRRLRGGGIRVSRRRVRPRADGTADLGAAIGTLRRALR